MANEGQAGNLSRLLSLLREVPAYRDLVGRLSTTKGECKILTLDAAKPYFIAALYEELNLPFVIVTAQPENARRLYEQLQVWCSPVSNLHRLTELDFLPYEYISSYSTDAMLGRLQALSALALYEPPASSPRLFRHFVPRDDGREECYSERTKRAENLHQGGLRAELGDPSLILRTTKPPLIVSSAMAIITKTIPQQDFASICHVLETGMTAEPLELLRKWQSMGYEIEDIVEIPGQASRRGGIIDVFPPYSQLPARIEFFGNQIESMRLFDPKSQRSGEPISSLTIIPAKEFILQSRKINNALNLDSCTFELRQRFQEDIVKLQQGQWFQGAEFYFPLFDAGSIFDYMGDDTLIILDDFREIKLAAARLDKEAQELRDEKVASGKLPQCFPLPYLNWEKLESQIEAKHRMSLEAWDNIQCNIETLPFSTTQSYGGKLEMFLSAARQIMESGQRVFIVSHQANRLAELLQEEGIYTSPTSKIEQVPPLGSITVFQGSLDGGWVMDNSLNLITDTELFGFTRQPRARKKQPIRHQWFLPQLLPGDYAVHIEHGIGRFVGLTRMSTDGVEREYLVLEYATGDKLYVPIEQIERISRYIGAGDQAPHLSRLGTQEWERTKRKAQESVVDMAQELIALYAIREVMPGFAFSPDTLWQQELEQAFPYIETPDQLEAIMAVKEDMEKSQPMDRLICGDVGYGKTEVALRAAFKTVMDNKQVALLTPTTVLARQHLATFGERLQTFPIKVEMLSRFCPPQKESEILESLSNGTVDICIGTHRLLQKDIKFHNLGLVIIDEEQQFGVVQKEKLKQLRQELDTLSLSATPIPRTLHMSLTGIRDMSIMETPPEERLSIKTYVGAYDDTLVRQVILSELERNGQVFFVHNRVQSIALLASKLQTLIPESRVAVVHGQMPEEKLENVMLAFIAGDYDVLVTTTIIQLGLDMPNVNTLIVDQADKFGLAQLYQLRGRVGRGANQAYAYFFFDKEKQLTPQANRRLKTIFEATELGSGFGIAMKDMEIRGAGNLLGVKQSGHIAAIGFDLYCQLLAEAVESLKAKQRGEHRENTIAGEAKQSFNIALPLNVHIPEEYVTNLNARLSLYHRLAKVEHTEEVENIARELRDRFGALPQPVKNLLYVVRIKLLAMKAGVSSIFMQGKQVVIQFQKDMIMMSQCQEQNKEEKKHAPSFSIAASGAGQSLSKDYGAAIKIGAKQIKLDTRLLGDRWPEILAGILNGSDVQ